MHFMREIRVVHTAKEMEKETKTLKVVLLGRNGIGKTALLMRLLRGEFPGEYIPTIWDNSQITVDIEGQSVTFDFFDTAAGEVYDQLRPDLYPGTDVFLICFSSYRSDSLKSILDRTIPELSQHGCEQTAYLIIQTKMDLYLERRKKQRLLTLQDTCHLSMLNDMLSEIPKKHKKISLIMPEDLMHLILKFAEYSDKERQRYYDIRVEEKLIKLEHVRNVLKHRDLRYGIFEDHNYAPYLQTSALTGFNLNDESIYHAIWNAFHGKQPPNTLKKGSATITDQKSSDKSRMCQIM